MRLFIRHPFDITMQYMVGDELTDTEEQERVLNDVSENGLCFKSPRPVKEQAKIYIRIPIHEPPFEAEGYVAWCKQAGDHYDVGVEFHEMSKFSLRMVEQACHIKHYMRQEQKKGRDLSTEQAALEWVEKYAGEFPR